MRRWNEIKKVNTGKVLIPYFLYFDDVEINNPLGPHSSGIIACYYSFPTLLPSSQLSKIDNIFVASLIKSSDLKTYMVTQNVSMN